MKVTDTKGKWWQKRWCRWRKRWWRWQMTCVWSSCELELPLQAACSLTLDLHRPRHHDSKMISTLRALTRVIPSIAHSNDNNLTVAALRWWWCWEGRAGPQISTHTVHTPFLPFQRAMNPVKSFYESAIFCNGRDFSLVLDVVYTKQ